MGLGKMEILAIAYVLTGVRKVIKAFRPPFHDRPAYAMAITGRVVDKRRKRIAYMVMFLLVPGWALVDIYFVIGNWKK